MAMAGSSRPSPFPPSQTLTITDNLPLPLLKSESIPPAPNPSESGSTIDWLPDFAGYSWIAYGASSLLVISQFPSPSLSPHQETFIGPIFRQSFELCSGQVSAVSWSLAPAASFSGHLAAAAGNRIFLFEYKPSQGSFCWSQSALLVQSVKVESIKWTGSGDGIVAGGMDVVLWKRGPESWEIAWKFEMKRAQTLVSTNWFIEGLSATGTHASKLHNAGSSSGIHDESCSVNVFEIDGKTGHFSELPHPQPVLMIQWRPSRAGDVLKCANTPRHILITSCLDGTVRFWGEIDDGRIRKSSKDVSDSKFSRRSFYVVAVIEINQTLKGTLGTDIFVNWALELGGVVHTGEGAKLFNAQENQNDKVGRCEWLVALGPDMMLTFWAMHCLDDIAPMQCPRLSLWKREKLPVPAAGPVFSINHTKSMETSHFWNVSIFRNQLSGPPTICSMVYLLPCNTLGWSMLYTGKSTNREEQSLNNSDIVNCLLFDAGRILNVDGHTGKVLQVALHPCSCEVDLAVSLDSNGLLLLWSLSLKSNCISGLPNLNSSWKLLGNVALQDVATRYKSLAWAPSWLDGEWVLLIGHVEGIDCCIIRTDRNQQEKILFHKLCTVPFSDDVHVDGPDKIFSIPLQPTCKATFNFNNFVLIGAWTKDFQALSWKITLHSYDLTGSCSHCDSDIKNNLERGTFMYESNFAGKRYCLVVNTCSQFLPDFNADNQVTSIDVIFPSISMPSLWQLQDLTNEFSPKYVMYNMVTGHANGIVRLWRSKLSEVSAVNAPWELMGMFVAHRGAVSAISVADSGQKIATICSTSDATSKHTLALWEPVNLSGIGCFILEDEITLSEHSNALSWFTIGNGKLVLGVCFENELHVYAQRRSLSSLLNLAKPSDSSIWVCISITRSSSAISEFLWGPCATVVLVHGKYFSLYGPYTILMNENNQSQSRTTTHTTACMNHEMDEGIISVLHTDSRVHWGDCKCSKCIQTPSGLFVQIAQEKYDLQTKIGFLSILEVIESLSGPLPFYHPEVLLMNIYSGNWKRAYATMRHVIESVASSSGIEQKSESSYSASTIMQVRLSNYFESLSTTCGTDKGFQWIRDATLLTASSCLDGGFIHAAKDSGLSTEFSDFLQILDKSHFLLAITDTERMQTFSIVDLLKEISNVQSVSVYEGLDDPGRRFWCSVRLQQLDCLRRLGQMPSTAEINVHSGLIAWAFHSDCQETLFNAVLPTEPSWEDMRNMGFGYWFTNAAQLRTKMEKLARSQYLKSKDPKACALLYIALNRLQVLAGLFKISKDEKDKPLVGFLSRNFQEEKHKAAALKNAYVLMSKHQLELAIAFFLLAGDALSAVNVCAKTLGDEQLALVICRLVEVQGGTLEQNLISNFILPSAVEKGDYWLSSVLEWSLGNYCGAFLRMLGFGEDASVDGKSSTLKHVALSDPIIGQFCQNLLAKNSLKNAVGEQNATILLQWAIIITSASLNKCGLPLEALECLSSSSSNPAVMAQGIYSESSNILPRALRPTSVDSSNWLSGQVALHLESIVKSDFAMQYVSKLMWEHPSCLSMKAASNEGGTSLHHCRTSIEELQQKLNSALEYLEQKFSLIPSQLHNKILFSLSNHGLVLIGYHILNGLCSDNYFPLSHHGASFQSFPNLPNKLHVAARDLAHFLPKFVAACSMASSLSTIAKYQNDSPIRQSQGHFIGIWFYMQGLILSLNRVEASLIILCGANTEDHTSLAFSILDLCKYCACLALATLQCDHQSLVLLLQPIRISLTDENYCQLDMASIKEILSQACEHLVLQTLGNRYDDLKGTRLIYNGASRGTTSEIPGDAWEIAAACLWQHVSSVMNYHLNQLCAKVGNSRTHCSHLDKKSLLSPAFSQLDSISTVECIQLVSLILAESIRNTVAHTASYYVKQLAFFLWKKVEADTHVRTPLWLEEVSQSQNRGANVVGMENIEASSLPAELFLNMCAEPARVPQLLAKLGLDLSYLTWQKPFCGWRSLHMGVSGTQDGCPQEVLHNVASSGNQIQQDAKLQSQNGSSLLDFDKKEATALNPLPFKNPREIYRKNGELLEALCINSIDQRQASLSIDRKGIIFFNWDDGLPLCGHSEYVWSEADWPRNGWAATESTPVPTCVSYGVGLGSKEGAHLGLGGATVGLGRAARPRSDLTGGGAFGIPGYAGIGASGMGWEIEEDFERLIDTPATLENVSTQALSAHPSRDLFLAGSRNTHIYLWKFGEEKATATYGVLPAANVSPPYALASVTALQFDCCGQRFANAASDGTVCTWQLEVGGTTNVRPTESSICFSGHASDISYVSTSGSIIAVAGYSSNGVNVVVWDTLAPLATSRASVMCHEGGASSIAVFDNDVGSGSISPLIVTGGKGGDVGLHDFRYIATGKSKRHRHPNTAEQMSSTSFARPYTNMGDHNRNGMLWYIPNAHSGSIAKLCTIPNTSLFLTGSKDGDVKLWDAKRAKLVFHWPKLHERHTFLQRSSSGFGSVSRVGLTDIQVVSCGFLSCGGDGSVKFIQLGDFTSGSWKY